MSASATFGLLAPLSPLRGRPADPIEAGGDELIPALRAGVLGGLWLRDLPCAPADDDDAGQGTDPFAHLAFLGGVAPLPPVVGTASVILGSRHPLVVARAGMTVQALTGGRLILGLGTGGKPAMNAALGVSGRSLESFRDEWFAVRRALRGEVGPGVCFDLPTACDPPPLFLATTDTERWRAVDGDPDGWLAFLGDLSAFQTRHDALLRISGRDVPVAVRLDATVVSRKAAPVRVTPERGRAAGSLEQLGALLRQWNAPPVRHLLVNVRSADPFADLIRLREQVV